jgi:hypothetical protein
MTVGVDWGDHEAISIMDNRISPFGRPGYKQPPTLDALCAALRKKGGQYDYELRADSIYGPLRLKTEPALIGIRKRRVQHQENARLYVFNSLRVTVNDLINKDGLRQKDKKMFETYLKLAWNDAGFGAGGGLRITQRMVLDLRNKVETRFLEYKGCLKNKNKFGADKKSVSGKLESENEIRELLKTLNETINANHRRFDLDNAPRALLIPSEPSEHGSASPPCAPSAAPSASLASQLPLLSPPPLDQSEYVHDPVTIHLIPLSNMPIPDVLPNSPESKTTPGNSSVQAPAY